jgi:hypothetical protein
MLTRKTYTPAIEAEAAPILPGVAPHLRAQVARQWARLLEMARSSENPRPAGPAHSQIDARIERKLLPVRRSGGSPTAPKTSEKLVDCSFVVAPPSKPSTGVIKLSLGLTTEVRA